MIASVPLVVPVGLTVWSLVRARRRRAATWLVVSMLAGLLFAVLNDAQTHGWGNLKVF